MGAGVATAALVLPFTPLAPLLGLRPVAASIFGAVLAIVVAYVLMAEWMKRIFYRHAGEKQLENGTRLNDGW